MIDRSEAPAIAAAVALPAPREIAAVALFSKGHSLHELEALPPDMQACFCRIVELIQGYGLERVHEPHIKVPGRPFVGNAHEG